MSLGMPNQYFKNYIQRLRKLELENVHLQIAEDISPQLKNKVLQLIQVDYRDTQIHAYYGDIKMRINSFIDFWNEAMDIAIKNADKYIYTATKTELIQLIEKTINMQQIKQVDFGKGYLPIKSSEEKKVYEEINRLHIAYIDNLYKMMEEYENVRSFPNESFKKGVKISLDMAREIFEFTLTYMSMILADRLYFIRSSLEEINLRVQNNLKCFKQECEQGINDLMVQLYEYNQNQLKVSRSSRSRSIDVAELSKSIEKIKSKIENQQESNKTTLMHLEEECEFWQKKIKDFDEIAAALKKLKAELGNVTTEEKSYNRNLCLELPGTKQHCWATIGENLAKRKAFLNTNLIQAAKALITHFCVGVSHLNSKTIFNQKQICPYQFDLYRYKVYEFDYGLRRFKETCDGQLKEVTDNFAYYYDLSGRYYIDKKGSKVYIRTYCASAYKLDDNNLLYKVTEDCGHSERPNRDCQMQIKDPKEDVILPKVKPVDMKGKLDTGAVNYIWESFGSILPEVLAEVSEVQPKNPIHFLAHSLLRLKYKRTPEEARKKFSESQNYIADIVKVRKEKEHAAALKWESKQVKRRKPEESDENENLLSHNAYIAIQEFIQQLCSYND